MICGPRRDADPAAVECSQAFLDRKCVCAAVVKGELTEARTARVPDSARDERGSE